MIYDLQKASILKRISAFLLDFILVCILAVGFATAIAAIVGFDGKLARIQDFDKQCVEKYNLEAYLPKVEGKEPSLNITEKTYTEMSAEGKTAYDNARKYYVELSGQDMMADYIDLLSLLFVEISIGLFLAVFIIEFVMPLIFKNGQTPGKKIFGVGVMLINGVRISNVALFVRAMLGKYAIETMVPVFLVLVFFILSPNLILVLVLLGIGLLQIILVIATKNNSLIHDIISSTVTVDLASQMIFDSYDDLLAYKEEKALQQAIEKKY